MKDNTITEIKDAIVKSSEKSKIYFGSDSIVKKKKGKEVVIISTVTVIHIDGEKGCNVLGYKTKVDNIDHLKNKPFNRMMAETQATIELVQQLLPYLKDRETEIHLDINPDEKHGSSIAFSSAYGWVTGMFPNVVYDNINHKVKPDAWCATHAADWFVRNK